MTNAHQLLLAPPFYQRGGANSLNNEIIPSNITTDPLTPVTFWVELRVLAEQAQVEQAQVFLRARPGPVPQQASLPL